MKSAETRTDDDERWTPAESRWPAAGSAVVSLPTKAVGATAERVPVGKLPVSVRPVKTASAFSAAVAPADGKLAVAVLDRDVAQRAGVAGLMLQVGLRAGGQAGAVSLDVDYSSFRNAYGSDWSRRLSVVRLPACAVTTPEAEGCSEATTVASTNDHVRGLVSVNVDVAAEPSRKQGRRLPGQDGAGPGQATVLALVASATSVDTGTFAKTSLQSSAAWVAGTGSGHFNYSYPVEVPPSPGGLEPEVELSYSSGTVDGLTNAENTQPSWIGEGWDLQPGFIERQYRACKDDITGSTPVKYANATDDLCYRDQNATLMWNGQSTELILDDASGKWRPAEDDGSRLELITGGSGTGYHLNEHWKLTTLDGTQYWFGKTRLPGWAAGQRVTDSVWGAPVFANRADEPCYKATGFNASSCYMAWRWNLDYVVDPHGNSMSYWYAKEKNSAGFAGSGKAVRSYDRGGWLERIEYGTRAGSELTATAPMKVDFTEGDRCFTSCWSGKVPNQANWPDTPWDLQCAAAPCAQTSPSFWSAKRLAKMSTSVLVGAAYRIVDEWAVGQYFPETKDTTDPSLWLSTLVRTGKFGGEAPLPEVRFNGGRYPNRVDFNTSTGVPPTNKYRLSLITNESGGQVQVNYESSDCTVVGQPNPDANPKRCFPQHYAPPNATPGWSWWNKYRVSQVVERDLVGAAPEVVRSYQYSTQGSSSAVLWHHNDAAAWALPLGKRSWSDWRGWPLVTVTTGAAAGVQTKIAYRYLRGMNRDRTDSGETARVATITDSHQTVWPDDPHRSGHLLEEIHYDSDGTTPRLKKRYQPWHAQTGLRQEADTHAQPTTFRAGYNRVGIEETFEHVTAGDTWRETEVEYTYDTAYGQLVKETDRGLVGTATDDVCISTSYARDTTKWFIDFPAEEITTNCAATPAPADVLAAERNYYDGSTVLGAAPTRHEQTRSEVLTSYTGTQPNFVATSTEYYDEHGRTERETDALGHSSTVAYTPKVGGPTTAVKATNEAGHTTDLTINPAWGVATKEVDTNDKTTVATYDPLGRLTKVWRPGRAATQTPDEEYKYIDGASVANAVESKILGPNGNQIVSYEIYDGLLRPRQTQHTAPDGKRVITDTRYDSRGLPVVESQLYNSASGPTSTLLTFADADVPTQNRVSYDALERVKEDALWARNAVKWRTQLDYGGDRIQVTPPAGGTAETVMFDALQRPTKLLQHKASTPTGPADETSYEYDQLDRLTGLTDPAGNSWTYSYDLRGRLTDSVDPDTGKQHLDYDDADQLTISEDGRGTKLSRTYDALGRLKELRDNGPAGALRASWTYDTVAKAKGLPSSATRHHGGHTYTSAVVGYTDDYTPTAVNTTIPAVEGKLAGTYTTGFTYKDDGSPATVTYPAIPAAGQTAETVTNTYTNAGDLTKVVGAETYLASIERYWHGAVKQRTLGTAGKRVRLTDTVDEATGRLDKSRVQTERRGAADVWDEQLSELYSYDHVGNVLAIREINEAAAGATVTQQCYAHDNLRRMTEAWTTTADACPTTPTQGTVNGPDSYWQSFTYDLVGNRTTDTMRTGGVTTTRDYVTPAAKAAQPHTLTRRDTRGTGPSTNYTYDPGGNLKTRTTGTTNETLTWNAEGRLESLTDGAGSHNYIYGADGDRLIAKDPDATTAYLGHTELRLVHATDTVEVTRHYGDAVRTTAGGLSWMITDHHGTGQLAVDADTLATTRRRTTPFGEARGAAPATWPDRKGFVGGTTDPTGLTHLGAREYDASTGRFISPDPILDLSDPQSLHSYAYGGNNPVTFSDPDGLKRMEFTGSGGGGGGARGGAMGGGSFHSGYGIGGHRGGAKAKPKSNPATGRRGSSSLTPAEHRLMRQRAQAKERARDKQRATKSKKTPRATKPKFGKRKPSGTSTKRNSSTGSKPRRGAASGGATRGKLAKPAAKAPSSTPHVKHDGEGSTPQQIANSSGGPTGGTRVGQSQKRQSLLDAAKGVYQCWRCGQQSLNPANMHLGHRNVPTSKRGNLHADNICLEGAACNLSAGARGAPKPGMSCIERGGCGAPYGRFD